MKFTVGQENAINHIWGLCADPSEKFLIVKGPAGTGKSEVIRQIAMDFKKRHVAIRNLTSDKNIVNNIIVTATSNKAVDALMDKHIVDYLDKPICTIYSALGIKPVNGKLVSTGKHPLSKTLIIIDESSFIGKELLPYIDTLTDDTCKVVFIGDPYQLPPVKEKSSVVYDFGIPEVELDEIVRQSKDNPIQALSLALRGFVMGGPMPELVTDNKHLFLIKDEDEFIDIWLDTIKTGESTKLIGNTNELVHSANAIAKDELETSAVLTVGDIVANNHYVPHPIRPIKTDATVVVMGVEKSSSLGYVGKNITLNTNITIFVPDNHNAFAKLKESKHLNKVEATTLERYWADLRPMYSCTIHKSQGSTYKNVFINLSELRSITDDNELSRLLYVAVSRASDKVYFTGTL